MSFFDGCRSLRLFALHFRSWNAGVGPTKDAYTIGDNPQFNLRVAAGQGSVWVLLTRHITTIEDFRENREYITLLVYQNNGKRIYYPCKSTYCNAQYTFKDFVLLNISIHDR